MGMDDGDRAIGRGRVTRIVPGEFKPATTPGLTLSSIVKVINRGDDVSL